MVNIIPLNLNFVVVDTDGTVVIRCQDVYEPLQFGEHAAEKVLAEISLPQASGVAPPVPVTAFRPSFSIKTGSRRKDIRYE